MGNHKRNAANGKASGTDTAGNEPRTVSELLLEKHREAERKAREAARAAAAKAEAEAAAKAEAKAAREAKAKAERERRAAEIAANAEKRRKAREEREAAQRAARTADLENAFVILHAADEVMAELAANAELLKRLDVWPWQNEREIEKVFGIFKGRAERVEAEIVENAKRNAAGLPPPKRPMTRLEAEAKLKAEREERERAAARRLEADERRGRETA